MAQVMIVDDDEPVRRSLARILTRNGYHCYAASSAEEARRQFDATAPDLVLSDVNLPGESGLHFVKHVLTSRPGTAVIMITGLEDPDVGREAVELGAYGYMIKPFQATEVLINIANAMRRRSLELQAWSQRDHLEQVVQERTIALQSVVERLENAQREVRVSQEETIHRLSRAAEFRHNETARHLDRMSRYCGLLAMRMGLSSDDVELLRVASPMHDVGKIGIPDSILLKPGKLSPEEFTIMKAHSEIGWRILSGSTSELLNSAALIAWTHHEKYDGTGYPRGLRGTEIPLDGRISAIADVFDALTSKRVYKGAMGLEESVAIMKEGRGKHFDPGMLDLFLDAMPEVLKIQAQFADEVADSAAA